jgi:hypothetical protein
LLWTNKSTIWWEMRTIFSRLNRMVLCGSCSLP